VTPFHTALPGRLTPQIADRAGRPPVQGCAQDDTRIGVLPVLRRRMTACGGTTGGHRHAQVRQFLPLWGGGTATGETFFLELPHLNSLPVQLWLDGLGETLPDSSNSVVRDKGAVHQAKAVQWPSHVVPMLLPPYSPERHPMERRWWDLKEKRADRVSQTIEEGSEVGCSIMQSYSDALLPSFTGCTYVVRAVETTRNAYV
jgi:hypothetical protein